MLPFRKVTVFCAALLSGCASYMSGSTQQVTVNSFPAGAEFLIKDKSGKSVQQGTTPSTVVLKRGNGYFDGQDYSIDFSAPGHQPQTYPLHSSVNKWYFGNLVFGGTIGTFIVDPLTGAMWSFPADVNVSLSPGQ